MVTGAPAGRAPRSAFRLAGSLFKTAWYSADGRRDVLLALVQQTELQVDRRQGRKFRRNLAIDRDRLVDVPVSLAPSGLVEPLQQRAHISGGHGTIGRQFRSRVQDDVERGVVPEQPHRQLGCGRFVAGDIDRERPIALAKRQEGKMSLLVAGRGARRGSRLGIVAGDRGALQRLALLVFHGSNDPPLSERAHRREQHACDETQRPELGRSHVACEGSQSGGPKPRPALDCHRQSVNLKSIIQA